MKIFSKNTRTVHGNKGVEVKVMDWSGTLDGMRIKSIGNLFDYEGWG